ncbi:MAG: hypothetical protein EOM04_00765 [Clostridia bacterium]|nr:hypothetical protein [Clostridia bacterium]
MKKAAALKYNRKDGQGAPRVVALGKGNVAKKIIEKAQENGIPLYEDPVVVEKLIELDINQEIPEDLYQTVAEILAYIYKLTQK